MVIKSVNVGFLGGDNKTYVVGKAKVGNDTIDQIDVEALPNGLMKIDFWNDNGVPLRTIYSPQVVVTYK